MLAFTFLSWFKDLKDSVRKMSCFMGKTLSEEVIEKIANHCVFKNMKKNKMSNYSLVSSDIFDQNKSEFLRKGMFSDLVVKNNQLFLFYTLLL